MFAQPYISIFMLIALHPAPREPELDDNARGFFGVQMLDNGGVHVVRVEPGSPAEKAGISADDFIQSIDSRPVPTIEHAREIIGQLRPGTIVRVEVRRGTETVKLKLKVGTRPES